MAKQNFVWLKTTYFGKHYCTAFQPAQMILEYNYFNTSIDLALATVVHYGLCSQ